MKWAEDYIILVSHSLWSISWPHEQYVAFAANSLPLSWTDTWLTLSCCLLDVVDLVWMPSCASCLCRAGGVQQLPANQTEPGETIIKGIPSGHHIFTVFSGIVGHVSSAIVHLSHEIEPLSARSSNEWLVKLSSLHWKQAQHGVNKKCFYHSQRHYKHVCFYCLSHASGVDSDFYYFIGWVCRILWQPH